MTMSSGLCSVKLLHSRTLELTAGTGRWLRERLLLVALLHLQHGLVQANAVHEVADAALGDDVGESVADLDADHGGSGEASLAGLGATEHGDEEHHRVGAPREDGCPACPPDLVAHSLWLGVLGSLKADEEGV